MVPASSHLLQNIRAQPGALRQVVAHQFGGGLSVLRRAAYLIEERGSVVFCGMGASLFASIPVTYALQGAGFSASLADASELLHYSAGACSIGAAFVLVSRSGSSVEITKLLADLKARGACVIAVTNEPGSPLDTGADATVYIGSPPDELVAIQTYVATLAVLDLLGSAVLGEMGPQHRRALDATAAAAEETLPVWEEASLSWRGFLESAQPIYLLARGPSMASAHEGALLFHEVAKAPAVAMGVGQFRHGPVEVADADFRALVFAPNDHTQPLNVALARDLCSLGSAVRLIGPVDNPPDAAGLACWRTGRAPDRQLSPILEILPVQLAAYRLAAWKGIRPGAFRVLGHVIQSEVDLG
jgi:glucosamine--fructose-6-phosphate aminotransferase (isomerizing)